MLTQCWLNRGPPFTTLDDIKPTLSQCVVLNTWSERLYYTMKWFGSGVRRTSIKTTPGRHCMFAGRLRSGKSPWYMQLDLWKRVFACPETINIEDFSHTAPIHAREAPAHARHRHVVGYVCPTLCHFAPTRPVCWELYAQQWIAKKCKCALNI